MIARRLGTNQTHENNLCAEKTRLMACHSIRKCWPNLRLLTLSLRALRSLCPASVFPSSVAGMLIGKATARYRAIGDAVIADSPPSFRIRVILWTPYLVRTQLVYTNCNGLVEGHIYDLSSINQDECHMYTRQPLVWANRPQSHLPSIGLLDMENSHVISM